MAECWGAGRLLDLLIRDVRRKTKLSASPALAASPTALPTAKLKLVPARAKSINPTSLITRLLVQLITSLITLSLV